MNFSWRSVLVYLLAGLSLLAILAYGYARLAVAPYPGFSYVIDSGEIVDIYSPDSGNLQTGDKIEQVAGIAWAAYTSDVTQAPFIQFAPGEAVQLVIRRGGEADSIEWRMPDLISSGEITNRLFSFWLFAPVFWVIGLITLLTIRPRDSRWALLAALFFVMAVWLVAGSATPYRVLYSKLVVPATTWLLVVVALHFHWVFPRPLGRLPRAVLLAGYGLASLLALMELAQRTPEHLYGYGAFLALLGSIVLLVMHGIRQRDARQYELLLLEVILGLILLLYVGILRAAGNLDTSEIDSGWVLFLAAIPFSYYYVAYRRQPGGMQMRFNRWVVYSFFSLGIVSLAMAGMALITALVSDLNARLMVGATWCMLVCLAGAAVYDRFQRWIEQRILGLRAPLYEAVDDYSRRIVASTDRQRLQQVLAQEIFPSLLIRQAAIVRLVEPDEQGRPRRLDPLVLLGVAPEELPDPAVIPVILVHAGRMVEFATQPRNLPVPWAKLALPLEYRGHPIGICLLGKRDPDDVYSPAELPMLRILLAQVALALVNTDQAALLHELQRHDIQRQEDERVALARDLHDEVLGQMTLIAQSVDSGNLAFRQAHQGAVKRVREVISGLRPPTLEQFGLYLALEELMDELAERIELSGSRLPELALEVEHSLQRCPREVELAVYRIVQQACYNSLRHARAEHLTVRGRLEVGELELCVEDDGKGFDAQGERDAAPLVAQRHFGLLDMQERAAQVKARLEIDSALGKGTQIRLYWKE